MIRTLINGFAIKLNQIANNLVEDFLSNNMKLAVIFVLISVAASIEDLDWRDLKSPMDSLSSEQLSGTFEGERFYADSTKTGRITNGSTAKLGDFPYQVYMISYRGDGSPWLCGGSVSQR
jgi:hypothetical protein